MLQLLLGGSGSGKTTLLYQRIRARAEKGEKSILLVPEQFTSSTEGRIYRELGDALSGMVESFSFTSLAEKILSTEGGAAVQTLSDAGRAVLVRRALEELQECVSDGRRVEERIELQELTGAIEAFLRQQTQRNRSIFLQRYFYLMQIREIAERHDMREGTVKSVLGRMRKELRTWLRKEAVYL